jgi:hypothetical protein
LAPLNLAELSLHAYPHTLKNMGGPHILLKNAA